MKHLHFKLSCPLCNTPVHSTNPFSSLKSDIVLQDVVNNFLPGIAQSKLYSLTKQLSILFACDDLKRVMGTIRFKNDFCLSKNRQADDAIFGSIFLHASWLSKISVCIRPTLDVILF